MATGYGSLGSGLAEGFLGASALRQKRDAAEAEAQYRQDSLASSELNRRIELTKGALAENAELINRLQNNARQNSGNADLQASTAAGIKNLTDERNALYRQLQQMGGAPAGSRAEALGSTPPPEDTILAGRRIMGKTSGRVIGTAPLDTEAAWEIKELANGDWVRINPLTGDDEPILEIEETVVPSAANAVLRVNKPNGVIETWIHQSLLPKEHGQEVNPLGYVRAGAGGPQQNIAPGWLLHPNPEPNQAQIIAYDKATMSKAEFQKRLDEGYKPVGIPGWNTSDTPGVSAAGLRGDLTPRDISGATTALSETSAAAAQSKSTFRDLLNAGSVATGMSGQFLNVLSRAFSMIGADEAGADMVEVVSGWLGEPIDKAQFNRLRSKMRSEIGSMVKIYTGEQSGRITEPDRELARQAQEFLKVFTGFDEAKSAILITMVLLAAEMMRINALLARPQLDLSDDSPDGHRVQFMKQLYKDFGGTPFKHGEHPGEHNMQIIESIRYMVDQLAAIQVGILRDMGPGGDLSNEANIAWANSGNTAASRVQAQRDQD